MPDPHVILILARIATAGLAAVISVLGLKAYLRTRQRSILALSAGAGLLAAGYFAEGALVEAAGWSIAQATVLESVTTLVAAATLVASLYLKDSRLAPRAGPGEDAGEPGTAP